MIKKLCSDKKINNFYQAQQLRFPIIYNVANQTHSIQRHYRILVLSG